VIFTPGSSHLSKQTKRGHFAHLRCHWAYMGRSGKIAGSTIVDSKFLIAFVLAISIIVLFLSVKLNAEVANYTTAAAAVAERLGLNLHNNEAMTAALDLGAVFDREAHGRS
jgi:hypothetical protein